jgi:outer membrane receptor for ferrienterochelin and colicin
MINRNLKPLAAAVALANAGMLMPAQAQTGDPAVAEGQATGTGLVLEEVIVTGIRQSLANSADIKRDSQGVVDAITAEDIGKFPDSNLAESLQRITGVSIDRVGGEGSRVTVRGFGGDFNMVTLNGRQMPTANLEINSASAKRSFDFATLSSDSITAVEVFKTGKANLLSGGIGSTINIKTMRPLEKPGLTATISANALHACTTPQSRKATILPRKSPVSTPIHSLTIPSVSQFPAVTQNAITVWLRAPHPTGGIPRLPTVRSSRGSPMPPAQVTSMA